MTQSASGRGGEKTNFLFGIMWVRVFDNLNSDYFYAIINM